MFSKLKEKLKSWFKKSEEEPEEPKVKKIKKKAPKEKEIKIEKPKLKAIEIEEKGKTEVIEKGKTEDKISKAKEEPATITKPSLRVGEQIALDKSEIESKSDLGERVGTPSKESAQEPQTPSPKPTPTQQPQTSALPEQTTIEQERIEETEEKKSRFSFFRRKLSPKKFEELFEELELILLENNVAIQVVEKIRLDLEEKLVGKELSSTNLQEELKKSLKNILLDPPEITKEITKTLTTKKPFVIAFVGINGSGKTTSLAKLAHFLKKQNFTCCLAAADTFRAASIEQLQKHADNLKIPLTKKDYGADPASVGFDAIQYAKKNHIDIVLIDTAGRMQNKDSLMREIEKIARVTKPDMKIFVGEAITGNDATEQAKAFNDAIDITGIILAKADVDEKGGTALSVSYVTKKPILFLGTGQEYEDLEQFNKTKVINELLGK